MNQLCAIQNYNIAFLGKTTPKPVYAIDREMKCTWFASANKAGSVLGISTPSILKCLNKDEDKRAKYAGDYCFVHASKVEIIKEDGTVDIDKEKIKEIVEIAEIARTEGVNVKKHRFYGMNKDHIPIPFSCYSEAEKITSASRPNIIKCLNGTNKTACGFIFFEPEEIEIIDETGKVDFDKEKFGLLVKRAEEYLSNPYIAEKTPIYALYIGKKDKEDIRFDKLTDAISELKISHRSINACLTGDSEFAGDYCFALASDVETTMEDGIIDVNKDKIDELKKKAKIASDNNTCVRGKAIYAIKAEDLSANWFEKSALVAKDLTISPANISTCLSGRQLTANGYYFIPAYKIEAENNNNETHDVDKKKLLVAIEELKAKHEEYKASIASKKSVSAKKTPKTAGIKKQKTMAESSCKPSKKDTPTVEKHVPVIIESRSALNKPEKPKVSKIKTELFSDAPKIKKASAPETNEVEKNKTPVPAEKKKSAENSSSNERKYKRLGKIYALKKSGDYLEFKDLYEASDHFEIDAPFLYKIIKSINGKYANMFFTCDADG